MDLIFEFNSRSRFQIQIYAAKDDLQTLDVDLDYSSWYIASRT